MMAAATDSIVVPVLVGIGEEIVKEELKKKEELAITDL